jgi:hypothetical protein
VTGEPEILNIGVVDPSLNATEVTPVLAIAMLEPLGVTEIPVLAVIAIEPVRVLRLVTPSNPSSATQAVPFHIYRTEVS